jgi:hypothetical protein
MIRLRYVLPALLGVVSTLSACAGGQVGGQGLDSDEPEPPQVASSAVPSLPIPESGAELAIRAIDPCRLLAGQALAPFAATPPSPGGLHRCSVRLVRPDNGKKDYLTLTVGAGFEHSERWEGEPITVGGRSAYRTLALKNPTTGDWCRLDFPLSATRSVRVDLDTTATDLDRGCAVINALAPQIAAGLTNPVSVVWNQPNALGRWDVCDLLGQALGYEVRPSLKRDYSPDSCSRYGVSLDLSTRESPLQDPAWRRVPTTALSFGTGKVDRRVSECELRWAQAPVPNRVPLRDTLVVHVRAAQCDQLSRLAEQVHAALAGPAPPAPAAPSHVGFLPGEPDEALPVQCTHSFTPEFERCRPTVPSPIPDSIDKIMKIGGPRSGDVACAILEPVMKTTFGADSVVMVLNENRCRAMRLDHTVEVVFGFYPHDPPSVYCQETGAPLTIAGQPAVSCQMNKGEDMDIFSSVRRNINTAGNFQFSIRVFAPRGRRDLDYRDPNRTAQLVDLAGAIIHRHVG